MIIDLKTVNWHQNHGNSWELETYIKLMKTNFDINILQVKSIFKIF